MRILQAVPASSCHKNPGRKLQQASRTIKTCKSSTELRDVFFTKCVGMTRPLAMQSALGCMLCWILLWSRQMAVNTLEGSNGDCQQSWQTVVRFEQCGRPNHSYLQGGQVLAIGSRHAEGCGVVLPIAVPPRSLQAAEGIPQRTLPPCRGYTVLLHRPRCTHSHAHYQHHLPCISHVQAGKLRFHKLCMRASLLCQNATTEVRALSTRQWWSTRVEVWKVMPSGLLAHTQMPGGVLVSNFWSRQ